MRGSLSKPDQLGVAAFDRVCWPADHQSHSLANPPHQVEEQVVLAVEEMVPIQVKQQLMEQQILVVEEVVDMVVIQEQQMVLVVAE